MAEFQPPGWLQNAGAAHSAAELRNYMQSLLGGNKSALALLSRGGVHPSLGNALVVTQTGSPSMAVVIKSGAGWIPGSEAATQGTYAVVNDADVTVAVTAAHATLARIDIVCFKVQDTQYSGGVNSCSLVVVAGTPSGSPTPPAAPANSITLAQIAVGAAVSSITNANITDTRTWLSAVGAIMPVANQTERDALTGTFNGFAVWRRDTKRIEVHDGSAYLPLPQTMVARAQRTTSKTGVSTVVGVLRIDDIPVYAGYAYRISTSTLVLSGPTNHSAVATLRITTDGSTPGTGSPAISDLNGNMTSSFVPIAGGTIIAEYYPGGSDATLSVLLTFERTGGGSPVDLLSAATRPICIYIDNMGKDTGDVGTDI